MAKSRSDARNVSRKGANVILSDGKRPITAAVTALIGHSHLKPCFHQGINLVTPQIPTLREAVQQNDQRPFPFNHSTQPNAVGFNHLKTTLLHGKSPHGPALLLPHLS